MCVALPPLKIAAFWDTAPCSIVEVGRHLRDAYCLHQSALIIEAVRASETSVYFNNTTGAVSQKAIIFILAAVRT
jgi:hypothetical protein